MGDDADRREGRPIRPPGWDYAGAYLLTLVSREGVRPFARPAEGGMALSEAGRVVAEEWQRLGGLVAGLRAGELVVMPNHLHGIVYLEGGRGRKGRRRSSRRLSDTALLGAAVARLKAAVTRRVNALAGTAGPVWRAGYRDVAVESAQELAAVRRLIRQDPARWAEDVENPGRRVAAPDSSQRTRA